MGKSKAQNGKRNKMMRQQKKERELIKQGNNVLGQPVMERRLKEQFETEVTLRNNNNAKIKISDLVTQMIRPFMEKTKNFEEAKNIVGIGVMAWNLGVIKTHKGENEMLESLNGFKALIPKETMDGMMKLVDIKCNNFGEYDQIIYDYEFTSINEYKNNLSLAYKSVNE